MNDNTFLPELSPEQLEQRRRDLDWFFAQLERESFEEEQQYFARLEAREQAEEQLRELDPYAYYGVSRAMF